jgi:vitamin B12 transporter
MKKTYGPAGLALLAVCSGSLEAEAQPAKEVVALAPVIVTASRTAETADETLASVTVIAREDIERSQALSVQEVLRGLAGISIANNGGLGKNTSLFLRGTESDHVLVLIDGIKVGSATLGQAAFQDFPLEQIERIEVVRGPRSSLYGSEAIGGVIQIFTRRGGGATRPYFSAGAGTHSTSSLVAGLQGGGERSWFHLGLSNLDTQGFNACTGKPFPGGAGCFTIEPDADGYRNRAGSLRLGHRFDNGTEVDFHALRAKGQNEFDGTFVNESESMQQVVGVRLKFSPFSRWQVSLSAGQSRDESDNFLNGVFQSRFDTRRDLFSLQNDIALAANQLATVGFDYQNDQVDSTTAFAVTSRRNEGLFAQYLARLGAHDLQMSLRRDDNEQFGVETTGSAAWGYEFVQGLRFTASYGTAFKAPTFNELFFPGFGNPNLQPEESRSAEVGLEGMGRLWRWSLHAYQTQVDNLIAFDAATFLPQNIDQARIRGIEGMVSGQLAGWRIATQATLLDPENRSSGPNHGKVLPRRAEQAFRLDVDRDIDRFTIGATVVAEGRRFDDLANTRRLGSYATVDLRAEYRIQKDWAVQLKVGNVFDKHYETAAFFPQDGTHVFVTLRYRPQGG